MKTFTLYWLTGDKEKVTGDTIADAMTLAGYSSGAVRALDFYAEGDFTEVDPKYQWNALDRSWEWTTEHTKQAMGARGGLVDF